MMIGFIPLTLPYKAAFYYNGLAVGVILALLAAHVGLSFNYRNRKYWCAQKQIKDIEGFSENLPVVTVELLYCAGSRVLDAESVNSYFRLESLH